MSWAIRFSKKAQKQFKKLPANDQKQIHSGLKRFLEDENYGDVKKIKTADPALWRLRIGNWRIIFDKDKQQLMINVIEVLRRTSTTY